MSDNNNIPPSGNGYINQNTPSGNGYINQSTPSENGYINQNTPSENGYINQSTPSGNGYINQNPQPNGAAYPPPNAANQSMGKKVSPAVIALICGLSAVVLAVIIVVCVILTDNDKPSSGTHMNSPIVTALPTASPTPAPTNPPIPVFENVSASSTRGADTTAGYVVNYYPEYIKDNDYTTAWSCDRNIELTPSVTFSSANKQHVRGIKIANGYFKSEQTYQRNRRITQVLVTYEGGSKTANLNPDSYRIMQDIVFDAPVDTSFVTVKVLNSIYGDWKDIAISEVSFY